MYPEKSQTNLIYLNLRYRVDEDRTDDERIPRGKANIEAKQGKECSESEYLPLRLIQPPSIEANYNGELSERTNDNSRMNRRPS